MKQTQAQLVDAAGTVHETMTIYGKHPEKDIKAMNATAKEATDGKRWWVLVSGDSHAA